MSKRFKYGDLVTPTVTKTYHIGAYSEDIVPGEKGEVIHSLSGEVTVLFNGIIGLDYCEDELELVNPRSESELEISLAKLREVANNMPYNIFAEEFDIDDLINRIKQELK